MMDSSERKMIVHNKLLHQKILTDSNTKSIVDDCICMEQIGDD